MTAAVLAFAVAACQAEPVSSGGDSDEPTDERSGDTDVEPPLPDCDPPLSLAPAEASIFREQTLIFTASGGTGDYVFSIADAEAGGSVDAATGQYVAGEGSGASDRVQVIDRGCAGEASATVTLQGPMIVQPASAEVATGQHIDLVVTGGSGSFACELAGVQSGAVLEACGYTAGPVAGVDVVRVSDAQSGDVADVTFTVSPFATFRVLGATRIFVHTGDRFRPVARGGSGSLDVRVLEGPLTADGSDIVGVQSGSGRIRVTDRFTGDSADASVLVIDSFTAPALRDGERTGAGAIHDAGDLDGDGYSDGVLGFSDLSVGGHMSGAVLVFAGDAEGLSATPVQVLGGWQAGETAGRDVELADINADGETDLLYGIDGSSVTSLGAGSIAIHLGVVNGFFEEEPTYLISNFGRLDSFGESLVACDFDGDGWLDLAVGANLDQSFLNPVIAASQGSVSLYRGGEAGFRGVATVRLFGELPDAGGTFVPVAGMGFGEVVRGADLDGDGACDLVVGASHSDLYGSGEDGTVLVFHGVLAAEGPEMVSTSATMLFAADGDDGNFGNSIEPGDVNGDGIDDLVIAHYRSNTSVSRGGAVHVFFGPLSPVDPTIPIAPSAADWYTSGESFLDYFGSDVAVTDIDGDGHAEVIVGVARAESGPLNAGRVLVYAGATITADVAADPGHDATGDPAMVDVYGPTREGRLGQAVATIGTAGLLTLAGFDDAYGANVGAPYFVPFADLTPRLLEMPGVAAGDELGAAMTLFDVDADTDLDLLVGAPGGVYSGDGANAGKLLVLANDGGRLSTEPAPLTQGYPGRTGADRFGSDVASAGDFNGDGYADLVVVALGTSRPAAFTDVVYTNPSECPGTISQSGSALIYLGSEAGLVPSPSFVAYGYDDTGFTRVARGDLDLNGDGFDDVVLASRSWDDPDAGGFSVVYGRPDTPGGLVVLCNAITFIESAPLARLGESVVSLGDLDDDGCDDVAVGAPGQNFNAIDQGIVRILWGWGGGICPAEPAMTSIGLGIDWTHLGASLAAGGDVDGDGFPDLVAGGYGYRIDGFELGSVMLISGAHLLTLPRVVIGPGMLPLLTELDPALPAGADLERYALLGPLPNSLFGTSVALVPDPLLAGRSAVAIGAPGAAYGGVALGGGVALHRFFSEGPDGMPGWDPVPYAILTGESTMPEGDLGATLRSGELDGDPVLLVGAPRSDRGGLDYGAAYVLPLPAP